MRAFRKASLEAVADGTLRSGDLRLSREEKVALLERIRDKKRRRALGDFYYFAKHVLGYKDMTTMHIELCTFVAGDYPKNHPRKLILEPRGTFKSSVVTVAYALWRLIQDPNLRILIDNEEFSKAKAFLREIRHHIEYNEEFRSLFGALDSNKHKGLWTDIGFNVSTRTVLTKDPNVSCAGIDSTKTGHHYDLIICDDLVSDKNVATEDQLKKVIIHYKLLLSLIDPGKEIIVIGTRWHFADLYGYFIESDDALVTKGKKPEWKKIIRAAILPDGNLLFPERLTKTFLRSQRRAQGTYIYSCQYLNDPTGGEDAIFSKEWLKFFEELPADTPFEFSIVLDPSVGRTKDSDFSAITVWAVDHDLNRYIIKVVRGRWNPTKVINKLAENYDWVMKEFGQKPRVGMESVAFQYVLKHSAKEKMKRGDISRFRILELKPSTQTTKEMRIRSLVPPFEDGKILLKGKNFVECSAGAKLLIQEYLRFPVGGTDDILDTCAYHEELLKVPRLAKPERMPDTIFSRILKDAKRRGRLGRSAGLRVGSRFQGVGTSWLKVGM